MMIPFVIFREIQKSSGGEATTASVFKVLSTSENLHQGNPMCLVKILSE
jgi:hypothetical protein